MFYYAVLFLAMFHLFALSRTSRPGASDEDTKVLMYLSATVAVSVPILGLLGYARGGTLALLAALFLTFLLRDKIPDKVKVRFNTALSRYNRRRPYPCLAVSFAGLFGWAWYYP